MNQGETGVDCNGPCDTICVSATPSPSCVYNNCSMTATATPSVLVLPPPSSSSKQIVVYAAGGGGGAALLAGVVLLYIRWRNRPRKIKDADSEVTSVRSRISKQLEEI